jgi:protein-L-isoaspartate(D-aspartate) O-methyltransferase
MTMTHSPHLSPLEQARFNMIEQQIRPWNVLDAQVLALLSNTHREDFVPAAHKSLAFGDFELSLGHGASMLAPKVEARILQDLKLTSAESVLEIGTGSGYMAALLARLAHHVTTLEINPELATQAAQNLAHAVVANVDVKVADGSNIDNIQGDFDVIVLSGSVAAIPDALTRKLKVDGRLAAIVGNEPVMRFTLVTRTAEGLQTTTPWDTLAPRLLGFPEDNAFTF